MRINGLEIDLSNISEDDMPNEQFKEIFVCCGVDTAVNILKEFGGCTIQVPLNGFKKMEQKKIVKEYDGTTLGIQRLARRYGTTEKNIRDILSSARVETPSEGQKSLFDYSNFVDMES